MTFKKPDNNLHLKGQHNPMGHANLLRHNCHSLGTLYTKQATSQAVFGFRQHENRKEQNYLLLWDLHMPLYEWRLCQMRWTCDNRVCREKRQSLLASCLCRRPSVSYWPAYKPSFGQVWLLRLQGVSHSDCCCKFVSVAAATGD